MTSSSGWKIGLVLLLMFVIFPAVSWYYLQSGTNFRKELIAKLGDHGEMADFETINFDGEPIDTKKRQKGLYIINFSDFSNSEIDQAKIGLLQKLHTQFDLRKDVFFLNYVSDTSFFEPTLVSGFMEKNKFDDPKQLFFIPKGDVSAKLAYHFPFVNGENDVDNKYFAVVDLEGGIRGYYDVTQPEDHELMVRHLAILIPAVKKRKLPKVNG